MLDALRRMAGNALAIAQIRLELLGIEVQEEKQRIAALLAYSIAAALLLAFAVLAAGVALTILLWDSHRWLGISLALLLYTVGGLWALANAAHLARAPSTLFTASIAELKRDRAALQGAGSAPSEPAGEADPAAPHR
jgi:uncharacterized membrane protein YqjE